MQQVEPYISEQQALAALDNGGRIYNLLTDANDGEIEAAELARVAGVINDYQKMFLYLETALSKLDPQEKKRVIYSLDKSTFARYQEAKPHHYSPVDAMLKGVASQSCLITGVPRLVESKGKVDGFIMVPIMAGGVTTFSMIPLVEQYDIYHIFDMSSEQDFVIAKNKTSEKLPERELTIAGVLKEYNHDESDNAGSSLLLEAIYYCY
ncbi:MAG: hypothetical protein V2I33_01285 [Kangiellaceae bacterium]|jgi:hypothetical protein|nr:hypothetical protein [Kangiellaceae bacterium]